MRKNENLAEMMMLARVVRPLLSWYETQARELPWRKAHDPYATWVSEIMLQQTRVEAVKPYYARFMAELPTIADLASVDETRLLKLWEGLGYYSRARNLKRAAEAVVLQYGGRVPRSYEALLTLPGIGAYTAGAIASIAFDIPVPAVDGNVLRIVSRVLAIEEDIDAPRTKRTITDLLRCVLPRERVGDFNQALMDLGATVCLPIGKARCAECPLADICVAYQEDAVATLPLRSPKKKRRIEKRTVWLAICGDRIALSKRADKGLLAGMWELPNEEGMRSMKAWREEFALRGCRVTKIESAGEAKHIFTHIEWHMKGYRLTVSEPIAEWEWVPIDELTATYPIPTAFRFFQEQIIGEARR